MENVELGKSQSGSGRKRYWKLMGSPERPQNPFSLHIVNPPEVLYSSNYFLYWSTTEGLAGWRENAMENLELFLRTRTVHSDFCGRLRLRAETLALIASKWIGLWKHEKLLTNLSSCSVFTAQGCALPNAILSAETEHQHWYTERSKISNVQRKLAN